MSSQFHQRLICSLNIPISCMFQNWYPVIRRCSTILGSKFVNGRRLSMAVWKLTEIPHWSSSWKSKCCSANGTNGLTVHQSEHCVWTGYQRATWVFHCAWQPEWMALSCRLCLLYSITSRLVQILAAYCWIHVSLGCITLPNACDWRNGTALTLVLPGCFLS